MKQKQVQNLVKNINNKKLILSRIKYYNNNNYHFNIIINMQSLFNKRHGKKSEIN